MRDIRQTPWTTNITLNINAIFTPAVLPQEHRGPCKRHGNPVDINQGCYNVVTPHKAALVQNEVRGQRKDVAFPRTRKSIGHSAHGEHVYRGKCDTHV